MGQTTHIALTDLQREIATKEGYRDALDRDIKALSVEKALWVAEVERVKTSVSSVQPGRDVPTLLSAHESLLITTPYGMTVRLTCTEVGELEIARHGGGTLTVIPLTPSLVVLWPLPVTTRQMNEQHEGHGGP